MSYRDAFRPCSRVSSGEKNYASNKKFRKAQQWKNLQVHISNYIKTCSTTPNTSKFATVKGWAKKTDAALHMTSTDAVFAR